MTRWSRTPLPEERLFLFWQSADDTAHLVNLLQHACQNRAPASVDERAILHIS
jgi:hypothetical protein